MCTKLMSTPFANSGKNCFQHFSFFFVASCFLSFLPARSRCLPARMKSCSCYPLSRWIRWQFLRWISCVPWWQESQEVLFFCVVSLRSVLHLCETGFWFHLILSFFSASQLTTFHKSHEMLSFAVAASAKMQKFDIALYVYVMFLAVAAMCRIGSMSLVAAPQLYWCFFLIWKKN